MWTRRGRWTMDKRQARNMLEPDRRSKGRLRKMGTQKRRRRKEGKLSQMKM